MTCLQHSNGLLRLQGSQLRFLFFDWVLKTFPFLIVWLPIISCKFLFLFSATNAFFWDVSCNCGFIWWTQCLVITLHIIRSFLLQVVRQDYFFLKSFWSILRTLSIWSFKMFSLYPLSMKFCFSVAQCFILGECGTDGFNPQRFAIRYAF